MNQLYSQDALRAGTIIPFNKPADWTSFDVVNKLRRITKIKKIGHAGTLDPFATGVLIVCFGKATKRVVQLMELEKEYFGTIELGKETDTHDVTGTIVQEKPLSQLPEKIDIEKVLSKFQGQIQQVPPMYSALKIKGQKLYTLARKGKIVEREPRLVEISEITLLDMQNTELQIRVTCSKGTYIRALARDIGRELGCGGYLKSLVRRRIGFYTLDHAHELAAFEEEFKKHNP